MTVTFFLTEPAFETYRAIRVSLSKVTQMLPSRSNAKLSTGAGVSTISLISNVEVFASHLNTSRMGVLCFEN